MIRIAFHDLENGSWKILIKSGNINDISNFMETAEVNGKVLDQDVEETTSTKADKVFETMADFEVWFDEL